MRNRASKTLKPERDLFYSLHEEILSEKSFSQVIHVVAVAAAYRTLLPGLLLSLSLSLSPSLSLSRARARALSLALALALALFTNGLVVITFRKMPAKS